jgi:light-regulated signal transduction histidine kinase (bacteriophytochrome)
MRIRGKLVAIVMVATAAALLLAAALLAFVERGRSRRELLADLQALATIVADNSTAALAFDDPEAATEVLRSLRAKRHVVAACLYDRSGRLFAGSGADEASGCPPARRGEGRELSPGTALLWRPVVLDGAPLGSVLLRSDLSIVRERLRLQLLTLGAALLAAALLALLLSLRLQRLVSRPVVELAAVAAAVRREGDYSLRAARSSEDEVGDLVEAFDQMLDQIQARDAALLAANEALEERVEERTRELAAELVERRRAEAELERRNRDLAASNRELDDFAYVASHDLKEPLRGIHNYAGFLLEDYGDALDLAGKAKLETLMRLARRMESLIDTLLHYSRVGRVDLAIEPVDLGEVVADVVDSLGPFLATAEARVEVAGRLPVVRCDRARIGEVFRNLVVNAVKYNERADKRVEIGALLPGSSAGGEAPPATAGPVFYVRDNGIGIPERHRQVVFDIFKRLHGRDQYGGGTGAGLTIVKKVVERHGGNVWLDSEPGRGTTFYFTLQASEAPDA